MWNQISFILIYSAIYTIKFIAFGAVVINILIFRCNSSIGLVTVFMYLKCLGDERSNNEELGVLLMVILINSPVSTIKVKAFGVNYEVCLHQDQ